MSEQHEKHSLDEYIQADEAAKILDIKRNRVYQHIRSGKLVAEKRGKIYFLLRKDVQQFQARATGRAHEQPPPWRAYKAGAQVLATEIEVRVRPGQQEKLLKQLRIMRENNDYTLPGSIERFVMQGDEQLQSVHMVLIWKSTELPDPATHRENLERFQAALADVLDWAAARIRETKVLLHT